MLKMHTLFESLELKDDTYITSYVRSNMENSLETVFNEIVSQFETKLNEYGFEVVAHDLRPTRDDIQGRILFHYDSRKFLLRFSNFRELLEVKDMSDEQIMKSIGYDSDHFYKNEKGFYVVNLGSVWRFSELKKLINKKV